MQTCEVVKELGSAINTVRDAAFEKVQLLLKTLQEHNTAELMKLWKGLFYGMWNVDGEQIQLERATKIADCMLDVSVSEAVRVEFWKAFLVTLRKEWILIDQYRLDKYYALARRMLAVVFRLCFRSKWSQVECFAILEREIMSYKGIASGLPSHFVEIYVEELDKARQNEGGCEMCPRAFVCCLHPFITLLRSPAHYRPSLKEKIRSLVLDAFQERTEDSTDRQHFAMAITVLDLNTLCSIPAISEQLNASAVEAKEQLGTSAQPPPWTEHKKETQKGVKKRRGRHKKTKRTPIRAKDTSCV